MADEDSGLNCHALADKSVAGNFTTIADFRSLLNFNERPNPCFVADLATVKIDKTVNSYVTTELHIRSDPLVIG
jgi:hypothetical protein